MKSNDYENYSFLSYAHKDENVIKDIIDGLSKRGHNLWWDAKIIPGCDWYEEVAEKIQNCSYAIIFLTENYVKSEICRSELYYIKDCAVNQAIRPLFIQIGEFTIPPSVYLLISRYQIIQYSLKESDKLIDKLHYILNKEKRMEELSSAAAEYWANGSYYDACDCYFAMIKIADKMELPEIYLNLGNVYQTEEDYTHAIAYFEKGIQICQQLEQRGVTLVNLLEYIGFSYARMGDIDKAIQYLDRAAVLAETNQMPGKREYYESAIVTFKGRNNKTQLNSILGDELLHKIADFQHASSNLMKEILKDDVSPEAYNCIRTNLMRLMNYCRVVGGLDSVITECNNDLKASDEDYASRENYKKDYSATSREVTAFRNFLGLEKPGAPDYDVFLSYKSEDQKLAERICDCIRRHGKRVFLATDELKKIGKSEYVEIIDDALNHSKHLVVVTTNTDYLSTGWVKHEWMWFESRRRDGAKEGEILLVFDDRICDKKDDFPPTLMDKELFKTSCYEERIFNYLW